MPNKDVNIQEEEARVVQPIPEKVLLKWMAPARPFKKRSREFYSTIGVIVLLLSVIMFFAREFLLIGVMLSIAFIGYVLGSVPPERIEYQITNKGIRVVDRYYFYNVLGRFWFDEKWGKKMLMVEHFNGFPTVVVTVMEKNDDEKKVTKMLKKYLIFQKPEPTTMDNVAKWMSDKIPLESE